MELPSGLVQFAQSAREFCEWVEQPPADPEAEAITAVRLLSSLLHFIQHVPEAEPELDSELEVLTKSESMPDVRRRFATLPFQYYSEVWNPIAVPAEADPIVGDLADDLADIYLDVKRGLLHLEHDHPFDAAFHWAFMFRVHWGRHATSALRALHCYLVDPDRPEPGTAGSE